MLIDRFTTKERFIILGLCVAVAGITFLINAYSNCKNSAGTPSGLKTKNIIDSHNVELKKKLLPVPEDPIFGNSFTDPNAETFNQPIKDLKM